MVVFQGKILDGRHRYAACKEAGVDVATLQFSGSEQEAIDYVVAKNLRRRMLSTSQRALVATTLATYSHGGGRNGVGALKAVPHDYPKAVRPARPACGPLRGTSKKRRRPVARCGAESEELRGEFARPTLPAELSVGRLVADVPFGFLLRALDRLRLGAADEAVTLGAALHAADLRLLGEKPLTLHAGELAALGGAIDLLQLAGLAAVEFLGAGRRLIRCS